ncbi:hypothetical protein ASD44_10565 [Mesorhizobium sp. Root554]|uniref:hypothetical protein n=1 Tax=unclassified Mesorhizobium TaxID=325217 RepID=UPI0006FBFE76|nr:MULTISPECIES: hypothetical protein [unclassified Mesorhizobium]KQZ14463.1 hypothetical protein ASD27_10575 [Mesorhizobium sp. Root1471]KQZ36971.1 hypothetical protein ASD44_10565 [Mesorhizobium sp. Root554]
MRKLLFALAIGASFAIAGQALAQTAADTDAALDGIFGSHEPYRHFLETLQKAVATDDRKAVAAMIDYPFQARINDKATKLRDAAHFIADYEKIMTPKVKHAVANQTYATLFANWQGVMIGDGEVWFSGIGETGKIKVTAIND